VSGHGDAGVPPSPPFSWLQATTIAKMNMIMTGLKIWRISIPHFVMHFTCDAEQKKKTSPW